MKRALPLLAFSTLLLTACGHEEEMSLEPQNQFIRQVFFEPEGMVYTLDGEPVQVYQYETTAAANVAKQSIAPSGMQIAGQVVSWDGKPHLYQNESQIVVYVGENRRVLSALTEMYGPAFAGN